MIENFLYFSLQYQETVLQDYISSIKKLVIKTSIIFKQIISFYLSIQFIGFFDLFAIVFGVEQVRSDSVNILDSLIFLGGGDEGCPKLITVIVINNKNVNSTITKKRFLKHFSNQNI
eukprot:TRINITY_DN4974_c0_g1_i1.p1 TRINITY_DN4974_c0_g1~~TRINITY_DN4974_c0_g1_i1.p1  ORF type:complete len:134 (+),score=0.76 TRINITY_DN4974_c0_g1_i1:52-402(+)